MRIVRHLESLALLIGASLLLSAPALSSEDCESTTAPPKVRHFVEATAHEMHGPQELDAGTFWYCRYKRGAQAGIAQPLKFDDHGVGTWRGVICETNTTSNDKSKWRCLKEAGTRVRIEVDIGGTRLTMQSSMSLGVDADLARRAVLRAFAIAPTVAWSAACLPTADPRRLEEFLAEFLKPDGDKLFVNLRGSVLQVNRAYSTIEFETSARDTKQFEYRCWQKFDSL